MELFELFAIFSSLGCIIMGIAIIYYNPDKDSVTGGVMSIIAGLLVFPAIMIVGLLLIMGFIVLIIQIPTKLIMEFKKRNKT